MITIKHLLHCIWPTRCVSCNCIIGPGELFCEECEKNITKITFKVCKICFNKEKFCDCRKNKRWFNRCCAPFEYDGSIKNALINLKNQKNNDLVLFLADKMAKEIEKRYKNIIFDCVMPVPMYKTTRKKRGYNQSELLASALANILSIPLVTDVLTQKKKAKKQHSLDWKNRKLNVKGIYSVENLKPEHKIILLVDDIISTGFTLNECSKTLRLKGAKAVCTIGAAKNYPKEKNIISGTPKINPIVSIQKELPHQ